MGGGGTSTNTTQKSDPWVNQQPYLQQGFVAASDYLNAPNPVSMPGSHVAGQSADTLQSIGAYQDAANNPYVNNGATVAGNIQNYGGLNMTGLGVQQNIAQYGGLNGTAQNALTATANGDYLSAGNPYLQQNVQNAIAAARPGIESSFAANGRLGSGAQAHAIADSATNTATAAYMQNYNNERGLQMNAAGTLNQQGIANAGLMAGTAGTMNQQGISNAGLQLTAAGAVPGLATSQARLLGLAGGAQDAYSQAQLSDEVSRYTQDQDAHLNVLKNYQTLINGNFGGTVSGSMGGGNPVLQGIGGAASLAGGLGSFGQSIGGYGNAYNSIFGSGAGAAGTASNWTAGANVGGPP